MMISSCTSVCTIALAPSLPLLASFAVQNPLAVFLYQLLRTQLCLAQTQQVYAEKTHETLTEEQRQKKRSWNELINLPKSKVYKVYWSKIVLVKFCSTNPLFQIEL